MTLITGVCTICREGDEVSVPAQSQQHFASASSAYDVEKRTPHECVSALKEAELKELVRVLSGRSAGREAILASPVVVRALTARKREAQRAGESRQQHELSKVQTLSPTPLTLTLSTKLILQMAAQASHAKGRVTKMTHKLQSSEGRRKALQTMLVKVGGMYE